MAACFLSGCRGAESEPSPHSGAWQQTDLSLTQPIHAEAKTRTTHWAGPRGRALRTIEMQPGDVRSWRVDVGRAPRLSFRPLTSGQHCRLDVSVRGALGHRSLWSEEVAASGDNPPPVETVELGRGDRQLELTLSVEPSVECSKVHWASPVVVSRGDAKRSPATNALPNVLLIGLDTLRADHLGTYAEGVKLSPSLDAMAEQADVWLNAFTSINNTNPSFTSLMTGLYPKNHGTYDLKTALAPNITTLAEILQEAGYSTSAVLTFKHLGKFAGLEKGFDDFYYPHLQLYGEAAIDLAIDRLSQRTEPFFLWLHLFDAHIPHTPPQPYDRGYMPAGPSGMEQVADWTTFREPGALEFVTRRGKSLFGHEGLYRGEVAYLDRQLGRLFDFLDSHGLDDNTILVVVADHGETLGERDGTYFDHFGLHDDTTHVPLIVRWPGQRVGKKRRDLVQHFDIFPTILRSIGLDIPEQDGVDLEELSRRGGRRVVFSQHAHDFGEMIRTLDAKYMEMRSKRDPNLKRYFDFATDPSEMQYVEAPVDPAAQRLAATLGRWKLQTRDLDRALPQTLSQQEIRQLEALGYVD